jgi:iron(III) transport system ATP-binding protein
LRLTAAIGVAAGGRGCYLPGNARWFSSGFGKGTLGVAQAHPRLEIRNIRRRFGGRPVVDDVSLSVSPGQVTCLLGPSGCGKSTTLRIIAGVDTQDSGEIYIDGETISDGSVHVPPERRSVGLMFQDFALFPHLTVGDNVAFGLAGTRTEKRIRVRELLEKVGLVRFIDSYPHELSGGEQQRVALARALAPRPKIMLMDEPFSGLDNRLRDDIRDQTLTILKEERTAVLLVTHEPEEAMRMADEIALMRAGRIVQKGAPYNIYNAPVDRSAAAFFSDVNVIRSQVHGALTENAFGHFLAPGHADGAEVDIVIRPQHLRIDFDRGGQGPNPTPEHGVWARGIVERARFIGKESLVEFRMDFDGSAMKASVPSVFLPKPGTPLWIAIRRDRCFVFPADRRRVP